jgi:hypothetical protein
VSHEDTNRHVWNNVHGKFQPWCKATKNVTKSPTLTALSFGILFLENLRWTEKVVVRHAFWCRMRTQTDMSGTTFMESSNHGARRQRSVTKSPTLTARLYDGIPDEQEECLVVDVATTRTTNTVSW